MNYIFGKDESEISNDDVFEYSHKLETFNVNNKELELFNNNSKQLNGLGQLSYEFTDILGKNRTKNESVSEIANFGEDGSESIFGQESTDLLDQIAPATESMHNRSTEHSNKTIANSLFINDESYLSESIDKTKASISDLELSSMRPNTLEIDCQLYKDINETVEQTISNSTQLESPVRRRNRKFGYYRWNRKDDTKMFNELRKACKQSNIDPEDFSNNNCFLSDQHQDILNILVDKLQWRRDTETLLNRIRTLSKNQTLSGRQVKTLRK